MSWRYILANLAAGNQPLSILDQMFGDAGALSTTQCAAAGTNAITLTPNSFTPPVAAYANLQQFGFTAAATSSGAVTLQIAALGLLPLYVPNALRQATTNDVVNGNYYEIVFLSSLNAGGGGFIIVSSATDIFNNTFTPVLAFGGASVGITYSIQKGEYTQIGKLIIFTINISLTSKGSSTGNASITGLPVANGPTQVLFPVSTSAGNVTFNAFLVAALAGAGTTLILITPSSGGVGNMADTNYANTSDIGIVGSYFTS